MEIVVAAAQFKPQKADYQPNLNAIGDLFEQLEAEEVPADLLVLPETVLSGYFLEGGVREEARTAGQVFRDLLDMYRRRVRREDAVLDVVVGFYEQAGYQYFNSALWATLAGAQSPVEPRLVHVHRKFFLPTYGVFDEKRFVSRGRVIRSFSSRFGPVAVLICEDAWHSVTGTLAALQGARLIAVLSASPGREFGGQTLGNLERWDLLLRGIASEHGVFVVYAGLVGFEGGKGFTGSSCVVDPWGHVLVRGSVTEPCVVKAEIDLEDATVARADTPLLADLEGAIRDVASHFGAVAEMAPRWEGGDGD